MTFAPARARFSWALAALARALHGWGWPLLDAQVENPHLVSMGAQRWPRPRFLAQVATLAGQPGRIGPWDAAFGVHAAAELAPSGDPLT